MALVYKPHTAVWKQAKENKVGTNRSATTREAVTTIRGQLTPKGAQLAFERFGIASELPYVWFCDLEDGMLLQAGDDLIIGGYTDANGSQSVFRVKATPMLWTAIPSFNYAEVLVERLDTA